jgi:hypothetical protein
VSCAGRTVSDNPAVPLSKIAWLLTVAACIVAAVWLLFASYQGYAAVAAAVGASAAINLR